MLSQDDTLRVLYSYSEIEHSCFFAIRRCIVEGSKKFTWFTRPHSRLFLDLSNQGFFQAFRPLRFTDVACSQFQGGLSQTLKPCLFPIGPGATTPVTGFGSAGRRIFDG